MRDQRIHAKHDFAELRDAQACCMAEIMRRRLEA
jgi:hypothetical protein